MKVIKLSDLLCEFLRLHGVSCVFGVTGGSILHPLHSAHKLGLTVIYTHHEQAASFAADAATRMLSRPQACFVTTGPAGTNALTGVLESWLDSIPQIVVSGQARLSDLTSKSTVRQIGSQHCDIISIVESVTKKAVQINSADGAIYDLLGAITASNSPGERMGPVWIDIPLDMQWAGIEIDKSPSEIYNNYITTINSVKRKTCIQSSVEDPKLAGLSRLMKSLRGASRPLFIIGAGINASPYKRTILSLLAEKELPFAFTWGTIDSVSYMDPLNFGLLGVNGQRSANFAAYLSDCIIGLGTHFSDQITGRSKHEFAPNAEIYMLDIDPNEIDHASSFVHGINFDLNLDSPLLIHLLSDYDRLVSPNVAQNRFTIKSLNNINDATFSGVELSTTLLPRLYRSIFQNCEDNTIFVADGGGNTFFASLQNSQPKTGHKIITSVKTGCMGSGLPQAIGAAVASPSSKVCCFIGDGSLQFNIQELMTISHNNLDISIIVINNGGYQAIKDTQNHYFESNTFGVDHDSGLGIPNYHLISRGYDIDYKSESIDSANLESSLHHSLQPGPHIIEIFVPANIPMIPALGTTAEALAGCDLPPIANMQPTLPSDLLESLLTISEW